MSSAKEMSPETTKACREAAKRLHHIGMRYAGAVKELATGESQTFIAAGSPGVHEFRDLISIVLNVRAELNAITRLLLDTGTFTADTIGKAFAEEYDWFAKQKADQFGVEVTDMGLVYKAAGT